MTGDLAERVLAGEHRALARAITVIENRESGYRDLVAELYPHAGGAAVLGITGSPGSGKSTLVDELAARYRDRGETVGVIAVDPASPFTGGSVLGDRIRMDSTAGDMDVFVRSMSARGSLGGLSAATSEAVTALAAFGKDRIIVETVGTGQSEIDVVRTADTVAVLVPPGSGDAVQMLKAGVLEVGDVFVVNKADLAGADRTVRDLREMIAESGGGIGSHLLDAPAPDADWEPRIVETVATEGQGTDDLVDAVAAHGAFLADTGLGEHVARRRVADEIRTLLREDAARLAEAELEAAGGIDALVEQVRAGEADPYRIVEELLAPLEERRSGNG